MKVKIIDLFAGIGGMRLGTEMAAKELGLETETVFSCEHDEKARRTMSGNKFPFISAKPCFLFREFLLTTPAIENPGHGKPARSRS